MTAPATWWLPCMKRPAVIPPDISLIHLSLTQQSNYIVTLTILTPTTWVPTAAVKPCAVTSPTWKCVLNMAVERLPYARKLARHPIPATGISPTTIYTRIPLRNRYIRRAKLPRQGVALATSPPFPSTYILIPTPQVTPEALASIWRTLQGVPSLQILIGKASLPTIWYIAVICPTQPLDG